MASQDNLLERIGRLIAGFDDASWEALASKGLLRRARKDIQNGLAVEIVSETATQLEIKVPPFLVTIPAAGPAKASCNCPSPGVCQHILAAGLYIQAHALEANELTTPTSETSIREEVSYLTPELLKAWAGAADYKAGLSLLQKNTAQPIIVYEDTVTIRIMPSGIEARFVPGGSLDGMIMPRVPGKKAAVAALLALRKSLGLETPTEIGSQQSLIEVTGTPRTKTEILNSARSVLEDAVTVGLSHVSPVIIDRLVTLAVSAQSANLPRVSLALRAISDEVKSILHREARADEARLLIGMARAYALMEAISRGGDSPRADLAGAHRAQYIEVPELQLSGVGAYTWETGSGYRGLTVLFWSNQSHEFLTWSEARPLTQQFQPRQRFFGEGPWDGAHSPQQVAGSRFELRNARRTINGRLSGSTKTRAFVLGATAPDALDFGAKLFDSWDQLRKFVKQIQPVGLHEPNPLDMIAVLKPQRFGARSYDSVAQTLTWDLYDASYDALSLSLAFREWNEESIRVLEELRPAESSGWLIVVRLGLRDDCIDVEPISILRSDDPIGPVFHLAFDILFTSASTRLDDSRVQEDDEESDEMLDDQTTDLGETRLPGGTYLYNAINDLNRRLVALAEAGSRSGTATQRDWVEESRRELHSSGLTCLSSVLVGLSRPSVASSALLKARFLTHLYSQAASHIVAGL